VNTIYYIHSYFLRTPTVIRFVPTSCKFSKSIFVGPNGTLVESKMLTFKSYMTRPNTNLTVETKRITVKIGNICSWISKEYLGSCVQLYSLAETPQLPPLPPQLGSYCTQVRYWSAKIDDISLLPPAMNIENKDFDTTSNNKQVQ
jgi:hypothetical protein